MPYIRIKRTKIDEVKEISKPLIDDLQALLGCPRDYFVIELLDTLTINDGEIIEGNPFVEVAWFDRGQETQDKAARIIAKYYKKLGYKEMVIYFTILAKNCYY